ncbi:MAG: radical SAM protein [Halanaerobiales bacterium]|nr:radical SAM protein [Halanaerobiales bacterium]
MPREIKRLYTLLTDKCNMKCPHCYIAANEKDQKNEKELSLEKYIEVIEKLRERGLEYVKLTGGEPLIKKDIAKSIIDYCNKNNINISLETNGTLMDDKDIEFLSSIKKMSLSFSLDFPDDRFDTFRVYPGAFEKVVQTIKQIRETAKGVTITVLATIFKDNFNIMDELASYVIEDLGVAIKMNPCTEVGRASRDNFKKKLLSPNELFTFYEKVHTIANKYPKKMTVILPFIFYKNNSELHLSCCEAKEIIGLMPGGNVSLCGIGVINDRTIWGNVNDEDILSIVENSNELIDKFKNYEYSGVCQRCMFKKCCANVCPAYALEAYGSFTASYPVCQMLYDNGLFPEEYLVS